MTTEHQGRFHPQYRELHAELLGRPFPVVAGQVMVAHRDGVRRSERDLARILMSGARRLLAVVHLANPGSP